MDTLCNGDAKHHVKVSTIGSSILEGWILTEHIMDSIKDHFLNKKTILLAY